MYVDSADVCNDLGFNIGAGTSTVTRSWTIKVWIRILLKNLWFTDKISYFQITQYDCNYDNLAPDGCHQYFYGETSDLVKTYNFDGGQHLASQDQNICIRYVIVAKGIRH